MRLFVSVVLMTTSSMTLAKPIEIWECSERFGVNTAVLVTATVEKSRETGTIFVAGVEHQAKFEVAGFDRRWDFGMGNNGYKYAFVIEPNGDGKYIVFGNEKSAKPRSFMRCHQVDIEKASTSKPQEK